MARRGDDVPGESPGVGHHRSNDRNGRVFSTSVRDGEDDDRKRTSARSDKKSNRPVAENVNGGRSGDAEEDAPRDDEE